MRGKEVTSVAVPLTILLMKVVDNLRAVSLPCHQPQPRIRELRPERALYTVPANTVRINEVGNDVDDEEHGRDEDQNGPRVGVEY